MTKSEKENGFTLIELLVVFSVTVMLSIVGIAAFVDYSRAQTVQAASYELATMFNVAKSRAQSQVVLDKNNNSLCTSSPLTGYEVRLCNVRSSLCINTNNTDADTQNDHDYELNVVCGQTFVNIDSKKLAANVSFGSETILTTQTSFLFYALTGGTRNSARITVCGYNRSKVVQINIDSAGNITGNNRVNTTGC